MSKRNIRKFIYIIFFVVLLCFGVGYASLNSSLFIDGVAIINSSIFEVNFQNTKVNPQSIVAESPTIDGNTISGNLAFSRTGEFYEFTFDVVNSGNVDAMIDRFDFTPKVSGSMSNYLTYDISYDNGEQIALKQAVNEDSFVRIKSKIEYIGPNTDSDFYVNFSINLNYVENDGTGIPVKDNGVLNIVPIIEGSVDEIGSIVTIGSEKFYVVGTEGDNVKLLSMYNLYVGGTGSKLYGSEATGMQDSSMLGNTSSSSNGVSVFSSASKKGTNYSDYNGSIVEEYVNNYKNILESDFGVEVVEARLITKDELSAFGCSWNKYCSTNYPFIYSTSYWTGTASNSEYIYGVFNDGLMDIYSYGSYFYGVRPVIVISKDNF